MTDDIKTAHRDYRRWLCKRLGTFASQEIENHAKVVEQALWSLTHKGAAESSVMREGALKWIHKFEAMYRPNAQL